MVLSTFAPSRNTRDATFGGSAVEPSDVERTAASGMWAEFIKQLRQITTEDERDDLRAVMRPRNIGTGPSRVRPGKDGRCDVYRILICEYGLSQDRARILARAGMTAKDLRHMQSWIKLQCEIFGVD